LEAAVFALVGEAVFEVGASPIVRTRKNESLAYGNIHKKSLISYSLMLMSALTKTYSDSSV
jgi:predicted ATP-dependent protease